MKKNRLLRPVLAALSVHLLLVACSATAHAPQPPEWPQAQTSGWPAQGLRNMPTFQAPSASHCARPVLTRETPGGVFQDQSRGRPAYGDRVAKAAREETLSAAPPRGTPAPSLRRESDPARSSPPEVGAAADTAASRHATPVYPTPQRPPHAPAAAEPRQQYQAVTAGVVDDNADFTSYLAFRSRTRVAHRPREIRERYLLEVRDALGRGISDAEVAVRADSGYAMWARTDAAGRVWLHPNAFDPARSQRYQIAARKGGHQSFAELERGQKSAVEVVLDAQPAEPHARLDLVFLIDATGSMGDEIGKLKATLASIVHEVSRLPSRPDVCLGLVAYRDRGDAFLLRSHDFTTDVDGFLRNALNPLHAGGGGDYPEAMNEALHETVHRLSWRGDGATRMVVLLADAPPHLDYGGPQYDESMAEALGKGIKVFSVGASGLDRQGEFIQRQIAQYTGGRFVFLTYAQAGDPASGPGRDTVHDVKNYSVDTLDRLIVRLISEELAKLARTG